MMTSDTQNNEAYVWIWLPGTIKPVVAGKIETDNDNLLFTYGKSYLARKDAISIYEPELPLKSGTLPLLNGLSMPNCIRDASPDAWGRRVVINKLVGVASDRAATEQLDELTYLLNSGSDRIGALDFQTSPTDYIPRHTKGATLEELINAAEKVENGIPLTPELDNALLHGSSIGGARPKANIETNDIKYIAKFSASNDTYSVVKAEYIAMRLADIIGINVAPVKLEKALGKDVLLVQRFDREQRENNWHRKAMVSALTLFELDEMMARYASYQKFSEIIRHRFTNPNKTLGELFNRMVFNILCGNTDDHARNHAAFWNGDQLTLTPAYDICPQGRTGGEATQAMLIYGNNRYSKLNVCRDAAHHFKLSPSNANEIIDHQVEIINTHWGDICDEAELTQIDHKLFWQRQFLNPFAFED